MKTTRILSAALLISAFVNGYLLFKMSDNGEECCLVESFEDPVTIDEEKVQRAYEEYYGSLTGDDTITGGIIATSSFEEMMCVKECNAIAYTFGRDSEGTIGPGGNGVFVIFEAVKVEPDEQSGGYKINHIGSRRYMTRQWCPPSCMPLAATE